MSRETATVSPEPMRLAQILDRSLKLLPDLFRRVLPYYVVLSLLAAAESIAEREVSTFYRLLLALLQIPLGYYALLATTLLASEHWLGNTAAGVSDIKNRISFRLALRLIGLTIVMTIGTILWTILFIIPGVVYAVNRILAMYILIVENTTVSEALKKSKFLMTQDKWYRFSSPWARVIGMSLVLFILVGISGALNRSGAIWISAQEIDLIVIGILMFVGNLLVHFFSIFSQTASIGFYYDLRARYEGADLVAGLELLQPQGALV